MIPFQGITLVGVGPGDPSLITLAAITAIEQATVVAYPIANLGGNSMAAQIASKWISKNQKQIPLLFPMVLNKPSLREAWREAARSLVSEVSKGEIVTFISQGDVSLFSTSSYLLLEIKKEFPECPVKLIPGISAISAAAALGHWPLGLNRDQLLILPTPDNPEEFENLLAHGSINNRVLAFLKLGHRWSWVQPILEKKGLLKSSLFAQKVGFADQKIMPADLLDKSDKPYFSLLLVRQEWPDLLV